jgi:hypothetical protein
VIPPDESRQLAAYLDPHTRVRLLVTPMVDHADVTDVRSFDEAWRLVSFLAGLLRE